MSESGDLVAGAEALVARFTQDTRLLQLSTPTGPDQLLAEAARIDEGLSELYRCEIDALTLAAATPSLKNTPAQKGNRHERFFRAAGRPVGQAGSKNSPP